ncbi:MAG TPA: NAD(P)/FAD-dependent oxidoreductase [Bacteroidia bacterium]|nr:NAD(P)/FAD-dependent oxidoreductase [Bacteroidia bacterium]
MKYDVAIIGGGPAGSSAATYLRMKGYSVVVFEKEKFPREHVGESLIPHCFYHLRDMGVLKDVEKMATRKPGINFVDKDGKRQSVWCFERILKDGAGNIFHVARAAFDKVLLDHSKKLGAEVLEEHAVKEIDKSNPDEVKITVTEKNGTDKLFSARFLIDASGQGSFLAKKLNDKTPYEGLNRVAFYRRWTNNKYDQSLNAGLIKLIYLGGDKKGWFWVIPIGRNYLSVGVSVNNEYVRERKKELTGDNWVNDFYMHELAEAECLKEILGESIPEHDAKTIGDYSYSVKQKHGENWAMVGDAGAFLDPIFSSGLFAAMETAKRVTDAVDVQLREGREAGQAAFTKTFVDINGGYKLIEKFVRLFYNPDVLNFSHVGPSDDTGFTKFTNAYNILHHLLAGDFFTNYEKYSEFIDTLHDEKNYNKFLHYSRHRAQKFPDDEYCRYTFEEVYGHLPEDEHLLEANRK